MLFFVLFLLPFGRKLVSIALSNFPLIPSYLPLEGLVLGVRYEGQLAIASLMERKARGLPWA
jgi:hypothetical protein